jgi:hypothetical protein
MFRRAETAGWCFPRSLHATSTPSHDQIQRRAPELWEQRGRPEGHDAEFWTQAERELKLGENPSGKTANAHTERSGGGSDGPQQG